MQKLRFTMHKLQVCQDADSTGITIFRRNMPFSTFVLHDPPYFSTAALMFVSPNPCRNVSSLLVPAGTSHPGRTLFSTTIICRSCIRLPFIVISRCSSGSFTLASMALSSALPNIVLISSGCSMCSIRSREISALKSIPFPRAALALSRMTMSRYSLPV